MDCNYKKIMKRNIMFAILILFFSCKKGKTVDDFDNNQMNVLNIEEYSANGVKKYAHYLYMPKSDTSDGGLIKIGQDYINGLTTTKPVFVLMSSRNSS